MRIKRHGFFERNAVAISAGIAIILGSSVLSQYDKNQARGQVRTDPTSTVQLSGQKMRRPTHTLITRRQHPAHQSRAERFYYSGKQEFKDNFNDNRAFHTGATDAMKNEPVLKNVCLSNKKYRLGWIIGAAKFEHTHSAINNDFGTCKSYTDAARNLRNGINYFKQHQCLIIKLVRGRWRAVQSKSLNGASESKERQPIKRPVVELHRIQQKNQDIQ